MILEYNMTGTATETLALLNLIATRISDPESANRPYSAMASLISPSLAITPDHALPPQTKGARSDQKLELHFERWSTPLSVAATVASRDPALDFAVLKLDGNVPIELPPTVISGVNPPPGTRWESLCLIPAAPEGVYVAGTVGEIVTISPTGVLTPNGRPHLQLSVSSEYSLNWQGMSGAPVLVDGQLVGVVARSNKEGSEWFAIPVTAMAASTVTNAVHAMLPPTPNASASTTELDEAALFQRLSPSSRQALGHADGIRTSLGQDKVHMEHLITGLYEKEDGPTQKLLHQAGLDDAALRDLLAEVVETRLPARNEYSPTLLSALPPLSSHARAALIAARNLADADRAEAPVQSRHLIYGALSVDNCDVIQALQQRGVRKENIKLADEPELRIAGFRSDNPDGNDLLGITREVEALCSVLAAKEVEPPLSLGLFGNWGSGKSFFMKKMEDRIEELKEGARHADGDTRYCTNIVQLKFNAWHYIDTPNLWASLTAEIFEGLAQALAKDTALTGGDTDSEAARARLLAATARSKDVLAEAERKKNAADVELRESEQRLAKLEQAEKDIENGLSPKVLLHEAHRFVVNQPEVQQNIQQAGKELNLSDTQAAATEVKAQLLELYGLWGRVRALIIAIQNTRERRVWLLLTLGVVLALLVGALLVSYKEPLVAVVGSLLGLLGPLVFAVQPFIPKVKRALELIEQAREENEEIIKEVRQRKREELEQQKKEIQQKVIDTQRQFDEASETVKKLEQQLDELRADRQMSNFIKQRYESTDYTQHLGVIARARNDFEQLSILLAKVREQEEKEKKEARRKKEEEEQRKKEGKTEDNPAGVVQPQPAGEEKLLLPRIDRIILYIDDLDRCPEEKVVDVLQAVHLLLAFPLFIVVVGVDPRWLLHSLKQHSKAFQTQATEADGISEQERTHWQSTPLNYLEKIFQIPFTLRPMKRGGFHELVENLTMQQDSVAAKQIVGADPHGKRETPLPGGPATELSVLTQEPSPTASDNGAPVVSRTRGTPDATVSLPTSTTPSTLPSTSSTTTAAADTTPETGSPAKPAIDLNPEHLRIETWEREFMKKLFLLIPSPRAAKRFVNIYRLVRASVDKHQHEIFVGDETQGQYRAVLLLLAILTGYPAEATKILGELKEREDSELWWEFIRSFEKLAKKEDSPNENDATVSEVSEGEAERWRELLEYLDEIHRLLIPENPVCEDFKLWAREVARYSFQSGRMLLAQRVAGAGD
jgi:hypothetical protein